MEKLKDWNFWSGVIATVLIALIVPIIKYISKHWFETKIDRVDLKGNLYATSDLNLLNDFGSPGIRLTVVCKGKRTAKISKTILTTTIPDNYILTLESPEKKTYPEIEDDFFSQAEIQIELIPLSKPSNEHGFILERDDIAEFFLPIDLEYLPIFLEAPSGMLPIF